MCALSHWQGLAQAVIESAEQVEWRERERDVAPRVGAPLGACRATLRRAFCRQRGRGDTPVGQGRTPRAQSRAWRRPATPSSRICWIRRQQPASGISAVMRFTFQSLPFPPSPIGEKQKRRRAASRRNAAASPCDEQKHHRAAAWRVDTMRRRRGGAFAHRSKSIESVCLCAFESVCLCVSEI